MTHMTGRFSCEVGLFNRRGFRRFLASEAFSKKNQLDITYTEDKGFLDSLFLVAVKGEEELVRGWIRAIEIAIKECDS